MSNNSLSSHTLIERSDLLAETITQQIMERILTNVLHPGDQLAESVLAEQFGVSRIPVHEALRKLENIGLVHKEPYLRAVVSDLTANDIEELHCVRLLIEPWAANLLATRHTSEDISALEEIMGKMQLAASGGLHSAMVRLDLDFHCALILHSHISLLNEMWELVSMRLHRFLLLKRHRVYHDLASAVSCHRPIFEAIAAGKPDLAQAETCRHLMEVYTTWQNNQGTGFHSSLEDSV